MKIEAINTNMSNRKQVRAVKAINSFWPESNQFKVRVSTRGEDKVVVYVLSHCDHPIKKTDYPIILELSMPYPDSIDEFSDLAKLKETPRSPIKTLYRCLKLTTAHPMPVCPFCEQSRPIVQGLLDLTSPGCINPTGVRCMACYGQIIGSEIGFPLQMGEFSEPIFLYLHGVGKKSLVDNGQRILSSIVSAANMASKLALEIKRIQ